MGLRTANRYIARRILRGLWACSMCVFAGFSTSVMSDHQHQTHYRVGVEDVEYLPLIASRQRAPYQGLLVNIVREFGEENGLRFEFIPLPIARFTDWYQQDNIDFRLPDNPAWNTSGVQSLVYSDAILLIRQGTVTLVKNSKLPRAAFKRIGTLYGFTPGAAWQPYIQRGSVEFIGDRSMPVLVRMLYAEALQGLEVEMAVVRHYAGQLELDVAQLSYAEHDELPPIDYTLSTIHHHQVLAAFNQYLQRRRQDIARLTARAGIIEN